jgi:hypothetical protein
MGIVLPQTYLEGLSESVDCTREGRIWLGLGESNIEHNLTIQSDRGLIIK